MRNFHLQAIFFSTTSSIQTIFFQENGAANNFLANSFAGFVTLLPPLTIPDFSRTYFTYLSLILLTFLLPTLPFNSTCRLAFSKVSFR